MAWSGRCLPRGKKLSIVEAILAAGLDWEGELRHIFTKDGTGIPKSANCFASGKLACTTGSSISLFDINSYLINYYSLEGLLDSVINQY